MSGANSPLRHPTDTNESGNAWIDQKITKLFAQSRYDRVVSMAFFHKTAHLGVSPIEILQRIEKTNLQPGDLWTLFQRNGGTSKESNGGVPEESQHYALRATWDALCVDTGGV